VSHLNEISPPVRRGVVHYAAATLAVVVATGFSLVAQHSLHIDPYVSLFLCAILFAAWFGGAGPGVAAVTLSIFSFDYFFIGPIYTLVMGAQDALRLLFFAIAALFVVWISALQKRTSDSLRRARDDLKLSNAGLAALNKSLQIENAERTRAEQSARRAERELQITIDNIPAIVARYRPDGSRNFANQFFRTYTGRVVTNSQGELAFVTHPDDLSRMKAAWLSHLSTGQAFEMEQRIRGADGEYRWFFARRVPLRDENGEVISWYGVFHDIEDRKQAERALQRSEAYLIEAQRLSRTGSFSWTISSGDNYWSKETYSIMGFDETVKPTIELAMQRIHPDDRKLVEQQLNRAFRGERDYDYEHRLLMPDGAIKYVQVRAHHQVYENGEKELVGALVDVTAARQAQDALQTALAELAHASRVATLGEMSASIAHEVNQPLAAIVSNGEATLRWLGRDTPDVGEARAAASHVIKSARRASEVIKRIREFSKKADLEMTPLDINEIVEEAATLVRHEALRYKVSLRVELASSLRPARGDRTQLQQVLVNLVVNGMQAMNTVDDRERILIIRTEQTQSDQLLLAVQDVGIGVAPDKVDQLFGAFYTTKPDGLGIGLSICRSIVEAHGGQIWASANAGPGMTFQLTIPPTSRAERPKT
jgi:PAS domain S-box-containing protein